MHTLAHTHTYKPITTSARLLRATQETKESVGKLAHFRTRAEDFIVVQVSKPNVCGKGNPKITRTVGIVTQLSFTNKI